MAELAALTRSIQLKLDGADAPADVLDALVSASVEQSVHLPGTFRLRFCDKDLKLVDQGVLDPARRIEISAEKDGDKPVELLRGEITSLELEFGEAAIPYVTVRGYDSTHRLFRAIKTRAFLNVKDSDLAVQFADEAGLEAQVETTSTVYSHLFQANESDLDFLMARAWRIGYECYVASGKLFFCRPPQGPASMKLRWGEHLRSFRPRFNLAEQVDQVLVKGWNAEEQKPIIGRPGQGRLKPRVRETKDGPGWASAFGKGELIIVDQPVASQSEADILAGARMDELNGAFLEAEGVAIRRPDIRAGEIIEIQGVGKRFSGSYLVTTASHEYDRGQLLTEFAVRGARTGLLLQDLSRPSAPERWTGVFIGVVTNTADPEQDGRVCVKFPWMSEEAESAWARLSSPGAGDKAGIRAVPAVGDEVLVAFEQGNVNRPCILGGLWSKTNPPPPEANESSLQRVSVWRSRTGHCIVLSDEDDKGIALISADGRKVLVDDTQKMICLETNGVTVTIEDDKVRIESQSDIEVSAGGDLKLDARGNVEISASRQINLKGQMINLN